MFIRYQQSDRLTLDKSTTYAQQKSLLTHWCCEMFTQTRNWFRRNAYGIFALRALVALGSAIVSVGLSFLPYDTILQAVWVIISSLFMASLVLRERLNENDDARYRRLFRSRFGYLQANDPEALTTVFAENLRPRVMSWFQAEYGVATGQVKTIDALDSLARNGDTPGQLIFRTGVELGKWIQQAEPTTAVEEQLEDRLQTFVTENESLLGENAGDGLFLRHIRTGEQRPVGIHMYHPNSRLLLTVEYYDKDQQKNALALSARSFLFENTDESVWEKFKEAVHKQFPEFQPANGGSGPQKREIPFFVGHISDTAAESDELLKKKLIELSAHLPHSGEAEGANRGENESSTKDAS